MSKTDQHFCFIVPPGPVVSIINAKRDIK